MTLFRTGLDYMPFYRDHPMIGPKYGDFHLAKTWLNPGPRTLRIGQLQGAEGGRYFELDLYEFVPPPRSQDVDLKNRSMYAVPWAIRDPEAAVKSMTSYLEENSGAYLREGLAGVDSQVCAIFHMARRTAYIPVSVGASVFPNGHKTSVCGGVEG